VTPDEIAAEHGGAAAGRLGVKAAPSGLHWQRTPVPRLLAITKTSPERAAERQNGAERDGVAMPRGIAQARRLRAAQVLVTTLPRDPDPRALHAAPVA
jgi:hypothetical protein